MKKIKLTIELIPKTSYYDNVRSILPQKEWDRLRKKSYEKAKFKCEICKDKGTNQGYRHDLECHEIWEYKKDGTQLLKDLISLCPRCHQVKHIGRSMKVGLNKKVTEHIMKVNKWTEKETKNYIGYVFQEHKLRSKQKWEINLSVLTEKYGVDEKLITENMRTKPKIKTKNVKYKKKKKPKTMKRKKPSKRK